jgi:hypothetical protein
MSSDQSTVALTVVHTDAADWVKFPIPEINAELGALPLFADPDTGMEVMKMIYGAGFTNPWPTHNYAHGIYGLKRSFADKPDTT